MDIFKLVGTIVLDGIDKVNSQIDGVVNKAQNVGDKFQNVGNKMAGVGTKMSIGLTAPLTLLGKTAIGAYKDFDYGMSEVAAISGATGDDLNKLSNKAKEMGEKTKFSAGQSAEALKYMAMAGWKTNEMLDGLDGVMNLAAASGEDLGTVSDIVTDALTAFGMKAKDSAHFADILATASSNSNTNVGMMGETFKYVAPVAGALGFSAEDTALAIGLMANSGIKASQAGTALRATFSRLAKPTEESQEAMEQLGISIVNSDGSMKSLDEIMLQLRNSFKGMTEAEQANIAAKLAGQEAMSGLLAIVNASETDYQKLSQAINGCDGSAKKMADTMNNSLQGKLTLLKSQLEGLFIKFVELALPYLEKGIEALSKLFTWISNLDDGTKKMIMGIGLFLAVAGPILIVFGKIISSIGLVIKAGAGIVSGIDAIIEIGGSLISFGSTIMGGIGSVVGSITTTLIPAIVAIGPVILVVVAVVGTLIAIGVALYKNWDEICAWAGKLKENIKNAWDDMKTNISNAWDSIKEATRATIENISSTISEWVENIKNFFTDMCENIGKIMTSIREHLTEAWNNIKERISETVTTIKQNVSEKWSEIKSDVTEKMSEIKNNLVERWNEIKNNVTEKMTAIKNDMSEKWSAIKNNAAEKLEHIRNTAAEKFENIRSISADKISQIRQNMSEGFSSMVNTVGEKMGNIYDKVKNTFSNIIDGAKDLVSNLISAFKFDWSLPKIKLPHFNINGEFSLNPPSIPHFSVDWYAKGGIMTEPTVFGINPKNGNAMVGGEAGAEAIIPLDRLQEFIDTSGSNEEVVRLLTLMLKQIVVMCEQLNNLNFKVNKREFARIVRTV